MKILVLNCGSSSLKYQLMDMRDESVVAKGNCERIGVDGHIGHKTADGRKVEYDAPFATHKEAFMETVKVLTSGAGKVIEDVREISAVGHRVLHGCEKYKVSTLITPQVIDDIELFSELGPLHNPPQALAMRACRAALGETVPMVAVFDTSFHQTMPPSSYLYGIPYEYSDKYHIRRYGFHGTSHRFVSIRCRELLGNPEKSKIIVCHLGNGSSISAVMDGKVYDTSMGFTPLEGLLMGTRCGDMDPAIVPYLMKKEGFTPEQMDALMNKKSGLLGVSGVSSDLRDVEAAAQEGNQRAQMAIELLYKTILRYIGAYAAEMNGVDAIAFTAGIGENSVGAREILCRNLAYLGVEIDAAANDCRGKEVLISAPTSKVKVYVIPTNEELMIARDTMEMVK